MSYQKIHSTIQTVKVQIDISSPTGRRLLKEVERHPRVSESQKIVKMDFDKDRWKEFGIDAKR